MKTVTFFVDFVSPYAWLAFHALPGALRGHDCEVVHKPVLLGAILRHQGSRGPAEIPPKRDWTYRQVLWLGRQQGLALEMPSRHPFNPLQLLCLALATHPRGLPTAASCEAVFRHVWEGGQDPLDPARLEALERRLPLVSDPNGPEARALLRAHTAEAISQDVFGTPTFVVDGRLFWGQDSLPMLRAYLDGDPWFQGPQWDQVTRVTYGLPQAGR
jgi:2-hydroxychromene-2-carboxylate isomerase